MMRKLPHSSVRRGVALTLITTRPASSSMVRAQAAAADTYRQLSLFGDV
jgi:hypothetical protein